MFVTLIGYVEGSMGGTLGGTVGLAEVGPHSPYIRKGIIQSILFG